MNLTDAALLVCHEYFTHTSLRTVVRTTYPALDDAMVALRDAEDEPQAVTGELYDALDTLLSMYASSPDTRRNIDKRYPALHHALENVATAAARHRDAEPAPEPSGYVTEAALMAALDRAVADAERHKGTLQNDVSKAATYGAWSALRLLRQELMNPERDGAGAQTRYRVTLRGGGAGTENASGEPGWVSIEQLHQSDETPSPGGPEPLCGRPHARFSVSCSRAAAHTLYDPKHHDADAGVWWVDETVGAARKDGEL